MARSYTDITPDLFLNEWQVKPKTDTILQPDIMPDHFLNGWQVKPKTDASLQPDIMPDHTQISCQIAS